jgi:hypothetical protein
MPVVCTGANRGAEMVSSKEPGGTLLKLKLPSLEEAA